MHFLLIVTHLKRFCFFTPPQWVWNWSSRNETKRLNWRWKARQSSGGSSDWRQLQWRPHKSSEGRKGCTYCFPQFQTGPGNCVCPGTLSYHILTLFSQCLRNIFLKLFHSNLKNPNIHHICITWLQVRYDCVGANWHNMCHCSCTFDTLPVRPLVFFFVKLKRIPFWASPAWDLCSDAEKKIGYLHFSVN